MPCFEENLEKSKSFLFFERGVFGLPDSLREWWTELRDTLQGDSWKSLKLDPLLP